jgi:hypothetical protein
LDTGQKVRPGGYRLTDETYAELLKRITRNPTQQLPSELKQDILGYYADPQAPISTKKNKKKWECVQKELTVLRGMQDLPARELDGGQ